MQAIDKIIPVLVYENIAAAHDFLIDAFGFTSGGVHRSSEGAVVHAEVKAGKHAIWLHRVTAEHQMASPAPSANASSGLVVYVEDAMTHCEHARSRGATIHREPKDMPYGHCEYEARDVEGHRWWFASPTK